MTVEPAGCVCDLWQYGVATGGEDHHRGWWQKVDSGAICSCGHRNDEHGALRCDRSIGVGEGMASIPPHMIEQDSHGPYILFSNRVYRPVASVTAPGVQVRAFNKLRDAAVGTFFPVGNKFAVSPAGGGVGEGHYLMVNTRDKMYGDTGRRELWCHHRIPEGNYEAVEKARQGIVDTADHWNPLASAFGVTMIQTAPETDAIVNGVEIPASLEDHIPRLVAWIAQNVQIPSRKKKT